MRIPASSFFTSCITASLLLSMACGDDSAKTEQASAEGKQAEGKSDEAEPPAAKLDLPGPPDLGADPYGADAWEDTDGPEPAADEGEADSAEQPEQAEGGAELEAETQPYPGPCKIRWSTGAIIRFEYAEDGSGKIRVDEDADGKADTCGRFERKDGKITHVGIDEGCDGKVDLQIDPEHDDKLNLATASYEATVDGKKTKRELTLVTMTQFTGVEPGYPLQAPRKKIELRSRGGLVRTAELRKPDEGPPMKVTFTYADDGRVRRITEDHQLDGTVDRRFDYRYDERGNVVGMRVILGTGENEQKGTARIDYACHGE